MSHNSRWRRKKKLRKKKRIAATVQRVIAAHRGISHRRDIRIGDFGSWVKEMTWSGQVLVDNPSASMRISGIGIPDDSDEKV